MHKKGSPGTWEIRLFPNRRAGKTGETGITMPGRSQDESSKAASETEERRRKSKSEGNEAWREEQSEVLALS
jgi:hypothetical protein